ncbi:MAG: NADH-quinone oxidoreductase subunit J [Verrucomicrobiae bacterium]|nr:NADH-quinone oxidoreductase subunit J [Verrucomicrobiae bacterium]
MRTAFILITFWTLASGLLAISRRNMIHCALALISFFAGIAALLFTLSADFLGAVQLLIYVGAISVLILFALLVTHDASRLGDRGAPFSRGKWSGWMLSALVFVVLGFGLHRVAVPPPPDPAPALPVAEIGRLLVTRHAVPFLAMALLLTAALVGSALVAIEESSEHARKE